MLEKQKYCHWKRSCPDKQEKLVTRCAWSLSNVGWEMTSFRSIQINGQRPPEVYELISLKTVFVCYSNKLYSTNCVVFELPSFTHCVICIFSFYSLSGETLSLTLLFFSPLRSSVCLDWYKKKKKKSESIDIFYL